jgi:hypothetical protein
MPTVNIQTSRKTRKKGKILKVTKQTANNQTQTSGLYIPSSTASSNKTSTSYQSARSNKTQRGSRKSRSGSRKSRSGSRKSRSRSKSRTKSRTKSRSKSRSKSRTKPGRYNNLRLNNLSRNLKIFEYVPYHAAKIQNRIEQSLKSNIIPKIKQAALDHKLLNTAMKKAILKHHSVTEIAKSITENLNRNIKHKQFIFANHSRPSEIDESYGEFAYIVYGLDPQSPQFQYLHPYKIWFKSNRLLTNLVKYTHHEKFSGSKPVKIIQKHIPGEYQKQYMKSYNIHNSKSQHTSNPQKPKHSNSYINKNKNKNKRRKSRKTKHASVKARTSRRLKRDVKLLKGYYNK